ncbi:transposase-like protein [Bradyrhizobium sp. GM6.1]
MTKQISLSEAMKELEREADAPRPRPDFADRELTSIPLRHVSKRTAVFQPRSLEGNQSDSDQFVRDLMKVLKASKGEPLDPITVWYGGQRFYVIDGHHRLEAYRRHHGKAAVSILCVEFKGTLVEAMEIAGRDNHKNKLQMKQDDRLNFAWRLVCVGGLTVERICRASGVSERILTTMRKKLRERLEADNPADVRTHRHHLAGEKWKHIRDGEQFDGDWESYEMQEARRMVKLLLRNFGGLHKKAHIFARAITLLDTKLPALMIESEAWEQHLQEIKEDVEEELTEQQEEHDEQDDAGQEESSENEMEF